MQTTYSDLPPTQSTDGEAAVMSWLDHLKELRDRMLRICIAVVIGLGIGFYAVTWRNFALVDLVIHRFSRYGVQVIGVTESFTNTIQLALGIGVTLAMPVI